MKMQTIPMDQMYQVLRGLEGSMNLSSPSGETYVLSVINPNAPINRCQETLGLCVSLDGPIDSGARTKVQRELSEPELETLRSGVPLKLTFGNVEVDLQSNPGGHLVLLED